MRTLTLRLFTNIEILRPVGRFLLAAFFRRFHEELAWPGIVPPNPESLTPHYYFQAATWLESKQPWPDSFEKALLEIEEMAARSAGEETRTEPGGGPNSTPAPGLGQPRSEADACGAASLGEAVRLWLKNHPTDYAGEIEEAVEADRSWEAQYERMEQLKQAQRPADGWQTERQTPEPDRAPSSTLPQPSTPQPERRSPTRRVDNPSAHADSPRPSDGRGVRGEGHSQLSTPQPSTSSHPLGPAILPSVKIDSDSMLAQYFMPPQIAWILGEDELHAQKRPVFALAEKSVRIGWTFCDGFKNVRKRLRFANRDYLFVTKDYPSGLEYISQTYDFAGLLNFTRAIVAHGEDYIKVPRLDREGRPTAFEEEVKVSYIKFDNKSRILAFSAHPQAMAVYGGDVGLDEFAKHPNAELLWQTAQGRVTWGYDIAVWSAHEGEDTLFNQFAQQARAGQPPWNLYYRVTIVDAIEMGLLDMINRVRDTALTPEQFIADCRARAGLEEIFQQTYMCNPVLGAAAIVDWSAIERCRLDYQIERVHLEAEQVRQQFGEVSPASESARQQQIHAFLRKSFPCLLAASSGAPIGGEGRGHASRHHASRTKHRLGFDVAASGEGDLAVIYIDEAQGNQLSLRALFTCRTEDWHFLKTVLYFFLRHLSSVQGAGDETGLGRQICWEAAKEFSSRFLCVNFASKKHDLGFALMNQLSVGEKRFPRSEQDIAADYFALRKSHTGTKWVFSEGRNTFNPASHCDIAWADALATFAHTERKCEVGAAVLLENGTVVHYGDGAPQNRSATARMILSDDPAIWKPFNF